MGQRKRKGRLWTAVFLAILAVTAAGLFCVLRFRGGVAISPSADVEVKEEVFYCQKDPAAWFAVWRPPWSSREGGGKIPGS